MVEIPDDVAKRVAETLREQLRRDVVVMLLEREAFARWADLLNPKLPSLRERVANEVGDIVRNAMPTLSHDAPEWDAALAVVADWLAAQPMPYPNVVTRRQRDHDLRLLRGGSDA